MKFLWPQMLWLLLVVPLLVGMYAWLLQRRKRAALRFANVALVKAAIGRGQHVRRHLPPLLWLLGIGAVIFAVARPTAVLTLPAQQLRLILAIDVSLSMRAIDVEPNRLHAAQVAAKAFIQDLPKEVRLGIVQFAGTASVVQTLTNNKEELLAAIDRLQLQRATATGSGIIISLAALFPDAGIDLESLVFSSSFSRHGNRSAPIEQAGKAEQKLAQSVPPGSNQSAAIILLSDGRRTMGPDPLVAAKMAADRGVRVFTVGFGTHNGETGFGSWSIYMRLDEETLKAVADITRAEYFHAGSENELRKIYERLSAKFELERRDTEIGAFLAALGALLALAGAALSLLWFHRTV